jgi:hypothetical protein
LKSDLKNKNFPVLSLPVVQETTFLLVLRFNIAENMYMSLTGLGYTETADGSPMDVGLEVVTVVLLAFTGRYGVISQKLELLISYSWCR